MRHLWLLVAIAGAGLGDGCGGSHWGVIPHARGLLRGLISSGKVSCGVMRRGVGGGSAGAQGEAEERPLLGMLAAPSCERGASDRRWDCWGGAMRLRGGARNKKPPARSWKQHGMHHARKRKASLRNNRNSGRNKAYTDHANKVLDKYDNRRRLEEIEKKEEKKIQEILEMETGLERELREEYYHQTMKEDAERAEKYQTLEDYSDSIERELETLRQAWKEVEKQAGGLDLNDPNKVWDLAFNKGNVAAAAMYNKLHEGDKEQTKTQNLLPAPGMLVEGGEGGGGGGRMLGLYGDAESQGPAQYVEEESSQSVEEMQADAAGADGTTGAAQPTREELERKASRGKERKREAKRQRAKRERRERRREEREAAEYEREMEEQRGQMLHA